MTGEPPRVQFLAGIVAGVPLALAGLELGGIPAVGVVVAAVVAGLVLPRFAFLSGALLGIGVTWLGFMLLFDAGCRATEDYCGHANPVPWIAASLALMAAGAFFAAVTFVRARRARRQVRSGA